LSGIFAGLHYGTKTKVLQSLKAEYHWANIIVTMPHEKDIREFLTGDFEVVEFHTPLFGGCMLSTVENPSIPFEHVLIGIYPS
jgi:hypothetical protein